MASSNTMTLTPTHAAATCVCLVLAFTFVRPVTATTDPIAENCSPACSNFSDVSDTCGVNRNCYNYAQDDTDAFVRCLEPCWDLAAPCMGMCWDNAERLFDVCVEDCLNDDALDCHFECFQTEFAELRSSLTVPSPDIGPFEE